MHVVCQNNIQIPHPPGPKIPPLHYRLALLTEAERPATAGRRQGRETDAACVVFVLSLSCWSCSTARTPGRGTSSRPSCTGYTESFWACAPSSGSRSTTSSYGETSPELLGAGLEMPPPCCHWSNTRSVTFFYI